MHCYIHEKIVYTIWEDMKVLIVVLKLGITLLYNVMGSILRWKNYNYMLEIAIFKINHKIFWMTFGVIFKGFWCPYAALLSKTMPSIPGSTKKLEAVRSCIWVDSSYK